MLFGPFFWALGTSQWLIWKFVDLEIGLMQQ